MDCDIRLSPKTTRLADERDAPRRETVGAGEGEARTAKQPQGPARGAFAKRKSQESERTRR